jgi:hypothetical protein
MTNTGPTPLSDITVTAAVGRDSQSGDPLQPPNVDPLSAGQTRRLELPVRLSAPSFGRYVVFGTVYGTGASVSFTASTRTTPWALFLIVIILVVDVVAVTTVRARRRRQEAPYVTPAPLDWDYKANSS